MAVVEWGVEAGVHPVDAGQPATVIRLSDDYSHHTNDMCHHKQTKATCQINNMGRCIELRWVSCAVLH